MNSPKRLNFLRARIRHPRPFPQAERRAGLSTYPVIFRSCQPKTPDRLRASKIVQKSRPHATERMFKTPKPSRRNHPLAPRTPPSRPAATDAPQNPPKTRSKGSVSKIFETPAKVQRKKKEKKDVAVSVVVQVSPVLCKECLTATSVTEKRLPVDIANTNSACKRSFCRKRRRRRCSAQSQPRPQPERERQEKERDKTLGLPVLKPLLVVRRDRCIDQMPRCRPPPRLLM